MKSNIRDQDLQDDKIAAIGIGAMIVFIALILVAAVAAAVIIQTAEQLQQNAQKTGDDTADNMAGKVMINAIYVDPASQDNYKLFVRLAPGLCARAVEPSRWFECGSGTLFAGAVTCGFFAALRTACQKDQAELALATPWVAVRGPMRRAAA